MLIKLERYGFIGSDGLRPARAAELHGELVDAQVAALVRIREEFEKESERIAADPGLNDVGRNHATAKLATAIESKLKLEAESRRRRLDQALDAAERAVRRPPRRPEFSDPMREVVFEGRAREIRDDLRAMASRPGKTTIDGMALNAAEAHVIAAARTGDLFTVQAVASAPRTFDIVRADVLDRAYELVVSAANPEAFADVNAARNALALYESNVRAAARAMGVRLDADPKSATA